MVALSIIHGNQWNESLFFIRHNQTYYILYIYLGGLSSKRCATFHPNSCWKLGTCSKASELDLADTLLHLLCRRGGARCNDGPSKRFRGWKRRAWCSKENIYIYIYVFFVTFQALRCVLHFGGTSRRFHQNPPTNPLVRLDDERLNLSQGGFSTESSEHKTHHKKWQKKPQKQSWTTNKTPKTPKKTIQFLEKTTNIPPVNVVLFQTSSLLFYPKKRKKPTFPTVFWCHRALAHDVWLQRPGWIKP